MSALLEAWSDGNEGALDQIAPLVYRELRSMARRYLRRERSGHTLQTGDLVNELYLRLAAQTRPSWKHRNQFFLVAAQMMRRILVDHARRRTYQKRSGGAASVPLDESIIVGPLSDERLIALDDALSDLENLDKRKFQVVELRYFGGLTVEETAAVLEVSPITVKRDWAMAKAWLYRQLRGRRSVRGDR